MQEETMPTNINRKEKTPSACPKSLVNADAWEKCRRWLRLPFGRGALILALFVCLCVGGVRYAHAQTYNVLHSFNGSDGANPDGGLVTDASGNIYGTTLGGGSSGAGTVFKVDPSGNQTVRHSFSGSDGASPIGDLIMDASGNLYGTTGGGGSWGAGTVFKLDPSGNETVLHSFGFDGDASPNGLVMDSSGNLYGTTAEGGTAGWGTVFKLDPSGNLTVLYSFDGIYGGPTGGLIIDSSGNLYGTTGFSDISGRHTFLSLGSVFRLDPSGNETVLHIFSTTTFEIRDDAYPSGGLIMDSSGNLYGTTSGIRGLGPDYCWDYGTVFKLDPFGNETVLHKFCFGDGAYPSGGLIMDSSGNFYGTTQDGGVLLPGTVFKLDPSGNVTVLHSFIWDGSDGEYPVARPVMDAWGNLYGTTEYGGSFGNGTVFKLDMSVPFSAFSAKLDIGSWPKPRFQLKAKFTQGAGAEAIDPVTQPVKLNVGTYTVTIPAGSFRALRNGAFAFEGAIDGTELRVHILPTETNSYRVHVDAACVDLTASSNPVPVSLYIGQNNGATEVTADFERRGMILRFDCPCEDHRGHDRGRGE
jgi:uncharacterized repeat protein (TIGR03803 family)